MDAGEWSKSWLGFQDLPHSRPRLERLGRRKGEAEGAEGSEAEGGEESLDYVGGEAIPTKRRRKECSTVYGRYCVNVTRRGYKRQARRDLDETKFGVNEMALAGLS